MKLRLDTCPAPARRDRSALVPPGRIPARGLRAWAADAEAAAAAIRLRRVDGACARLSALPVDGRSAARRGWRALAVDVAVAEGSALTVAASADSSDAAVPVWAAATLSGRRAFGAADGTRPLPRRRCRAGVGWRGRLAADAAMAALAAACAAVLAAALGIRSGRRGCVGIDLGSGLRPRPRWRQRRWRQPRSRAAPWHCRMQASRRERCRRRRRRRQSVRRPGPASSRPVRPAPARRPVGCGIGWPKPGRTADFRSISGSSGFESAGLRPGARGASAFASALAAASARFLARGVAIVRIALRRAVGSRRVARSPVVRAFAAASSERRCEAVCGDPWARALLLSAGCAVVDQRRETVVSARLVGFAGFRRRRALERHAGYWICRHAGHGRPFADEFWTEISKDRATPGSKKYLINFKWL